MDIADYKDYRDYLSKIFENEKRKNSKFSFQFCAIKTGLSRGYLNQIVQKKRHITLEHIHKFSQLLKHTDFEKQYFTFLVLRNTTKSREMIAYFDTILSSLRYEQFFTSNESSETIPKDKSFVFSNWLYQALHSFCETKSFREDMEYIYSHLNSPPAKNIIKSAWERLLDSGAVYRKDGHFTTTPLGRNRKTFDSMQAFTDCKSIMLKAIDAVSNPINFKPNIFQVMSLSFNKEDIKKALSLCAQFQNDLVNLSKKSENPTQVFLISNNMFAITKNPDELN